MAKRMIIMLILAGLVLGGVFGFEIFRGNMIKKFMAAAGAPAQTVSTTVASSQEWQTKLEAVGSLRAINGVNVSNELEGIVEEIHFDSGNDVKGGALLVKLRADDDIAQLHSLEAAEKLAETTYNRDLKQLKVQAVAQATVDIDAANLASAKAQVKQQKAVIDKKYIHAPFAGHLGIRNIDLGQYLNPGTSIVTLQQLDPIYLDFFLPEQSLAQVKIGQKITVKNDTYPDKLFIGVITAINPSVDTSTRNVQVRALLKNPARLLLPGMYATADVEVGEPQSYITLPQTVITYNPYGNTVFLVKEKASEPNPAGKKEENNKKTNDKNAKPAAPQYVAEQSFVTIAYTRGDQVAITKGVNEGDVVVTSGQIKLHNGAPILINNEVQPTDDANPTPQEQ